jgi:nucleoside-specific outer membrane channel protein Tsx
MYGNNYKANPIWIEACENALNKAYWHQDMLDRCVEEGTISEGYYLKQTNGFVKAFYEDLTWHHLFMIEHAKLAEYSKV